MSVAGIHFVDFYYENIPYRFYHDPQQSKSKNNGGKILYFGQFRDQAPGDLEVGKQYCLKEIRAQDPGSEGCAALRECYELLDFQGDHLRRILLKNDTARHVEKELKKYNRVAHTVSHCMVIEPFYFSAERYFTQCSQLPVAERLDAVRQVALGSEELSRDPNRIDGRCIMAHRDVKWGNIMVEHGKDGVRIRLVDFATIWLEGSRQTGTKVLSGTLKMPLSRQNTSPESILDVFPVTQKTDVYALGMMLASMFVRCQGKYKNPNEIWYTINGWDDNDTQKMCQQLQRCLEAYETSPDMTQTWIERDLRDSHNISLTWEPVSQQVLKRIRELFFRSTRIDPKYRIDRQDFINELADIIRLEKGLQEAGTRQPVSLYLFDSTELKKHQVGYQLAARKAFKRECLQAQQKMDTPPLALCIGYCSPRRGQKISQCLSRLVDYPCGSEEEISDGISRLQEAEPASDNFLLYALYHAYTCLHSNLEQYRFTGRVYLFTPQIPTQEQLAPFDSYDLSGICRKWLDQLCGQQTGFFAYTGKEPRTPQQQWCEYKLLRLGAHRDEEAEPEPEPEDILQSGAKFSDGRKFDVSPMAPYIKLPNDERLYVGVIE